MKTTNQRKPGIILMVEDDRADQELTRRAFEGRKSDIDLRIVEDGEEALAYLFRQGKYENPANSPRPDLLLLDLNLPRVDGRQVLEQIRADAELRRIAVVVLTTSRQEKDILCSYELGCNSFIPKPGTLKQFIQVIQGLEDYWFQIAALPPKTE